MQAFKAAIAISAMLGLLHAPTVYAIEYTLTTTIKGVNGWRINDSGQVSGWDQIGNSVLFTPGVGVFTLPKPVGVAWSGGYQLNEAGQVGGIILYSSSYWGQTYSSFVYTPGAASPYTLRNGPQPGIGYTMDDEGNFSRIPSGTPSWAVREPVGTDIAGGYVAGYAYYSPLNSYGGAFRQNPDGSFTTIGQSFTNAESQSYGVNSTGVTVGRVIPSNSTLWAFVYADGQANNLFDVTNPASRAGWTHFYSAQDVNSSGQITGWGYFSDSTYSGMAAFVLAPVTAAVPEPTMYELLALGLLVLGARCRLQSTARRLAR